MLLRGGNEPVRQRTFAGAFALLLAVALGGCGFSSAGTPTPTPSPQPHKTAEVAAGPDRQATAVAQANATSAAVQHLAATAAAQLQKTANAQATAQAQSQARANAQQTQQAKPPPTTVAPTSKPGAPPTSVPTQVVRVAPTPTPKPTAVHHPAHHTTHHPSRPTLRTLATVSCCHNGEFKGAAERKSAPFTVHGSWVLRWSATCTGLKSGKQPIIYIAIIPVGSKQPIQFIQEPMPASSPGTGIANENLRGKYYLDVLSACHAFSSSAFGPSRANVSGREQLAAIAQAKAKNQLPALNAVRTSLFGKAAGTHSLSPARAKALAKARALYVAHVTKLYGKVRIIRNHVSKAVKSVDVTSSDFNPSALKTTRAQIDAATSALQSDVSSLSHVKSLKGQNAAKSHLRHAIGHLLDASTAVRAALKSLRHGDNAEAANQVSSAIGDTNAATADLKAVKAALAKLK
jgi:hypothetical protein